MPSEFIFYYPVSEEDALKEKNAMRNQNTSKRGNPEGTRRGAAQHFLETFDPKTRRRKHALPHDNSLVKGVT